MNAEEGLEAVIRQNSQTLAEIFKATLKSKNNLMKTQMTSLIAAVAIYSSEGYTTVLTVLHTIDERNKFKFMVDTIDRERGILYLPFDEISC